MEDHIKIVKPKRCADNGTYEGKIYTGKKQPITLDIPNIHIVSKKVNNKDLYIHLRYINTVAKTLKKDLIDRLCDINTKVLQCVKENCAIWFRNALTDDLIEDYYSNIISYDKTLGQIYKFKVTNSVDSIEDSLLNQTVNMKITLTNIRFFKQKFVLEWVIEEIEILDGGCIHDVQDGDDASSETEDIPYPCPEDVDTVKAEYLDRLRQHIERLSQEQSLFQGYLDKIHDTNDFNRLSNILEAVDNIFENASHS
jgi:hypothetical protein